MAPFSNQSTDLSPAARLILRPQSLEDGGTGKEVSFYASWFCEDTITAPDRLKLEDSTFTEIASFKVSWLNGTVLEHIAHFTEVLVEAWSGYKQVKYAVDYKYNKLSPSFNASFSFAKSLVTLIGYANSGDSWKKYFKINKNFFYKFGSKALLAFAGSFEKNFMDADATAWNNLKAYVKNRLARLEKG